VMVGGTCVEHCPKNKIPIEGECKRDALALGPSVRDDQPVKIAIRMDPSLVSASDIYDRQSSDGELRYFIYRYTYEPARTSRHSVPRKTLARGREGSPRKSISHSI